MATERNRYYTKPASSASLAFGYGWDETAVGLGGGSQPVTGVWNPITVDSSGYLKVNPQPSTATYTSVFTSITGSQTTIPAGAFNWSITAQSGVPYVNGAPMFSVSTIDGGGSIGRLATAIAVGVTGGRALVTYDI